MQIFLEIVESIGLIVGSVAAAIPLCWSLWRAFRLIRHPAWGPPIVVVPVILWAANMGGLSTATPCPAIAAWPCSTCDSSCTLGGDAPD